VSRLVARVRVTAFMRVLSCGEVGGSAGTLCPGETQCGRRAWTSGDVESLQLDQEYFQWPIDSRH